MHACMRIHLNTCYALKSNREEDMIRIHIHAERILIVRVCVVCWLTGFFLIQLFLALFLSYENLIVWLSLSIKIIFQL